MTAVVREGTAGRVIVARLENKKEIINEVKELCVKKGIRSGIITTLIGGLQEAELISMNSADKELINKQINHKGPFEVQGTGTIAMKGDEVVPHIHITLAKFGNESLSGHLVKGKIALFIEIAILELKNISMIKKAEPEIFNLELLNFGD